MDAPRYPVWPLPDSPSDEGRLWLRWLVRLRWVAIIAQVLTVSASLRVLDGPMVVLAAAVVEVVLVAGNLRALRLLSNSHPIGQGTLIAQLGLDVLALTVLFFLAGGPGNPFTVLYLVHVAMGAVMLHPRWAAAMTGGVLACYAALHLGHLPLHLDRHSLGETAVGQLGLVVAFTITAVSVTGFVIGVASTLRWRSKLLLEARDRTARTDRLRSVGTLAAGAAHELNTPLNTVGLRLRRIGRRHSDGDTESDLEVMRAQLERCNQIVQQLLVGAGDPAASMLHRAELRDLVSHAVQMWSKGSGVEVRVDDQAGPIEVEVPRIAFTQALVNLLENAREAQVEVGVDAPIEVEVRRGGGRGIVVVRDRGVGLPEDLDRVGDPFYTTKSTGTGLGVYVARAVADGSGGGLNYVKGTDRATEAHWWFPQADRRSA